MIKNTKLFISILFLTILQASILTATDMPIQANQLPKKAQDFISANFANDPVVYENKTETVLRQNFKAE